MNLKTPILLLSEREFCSSFKAQLDTEFSCQFSAHFQNQDAILLVDIETVSLNTIQTNQPVLVFSDTGYKSQNEHMHLDILGVFSFSSPEARQVISLLKHLKGLDTQTASYSLQKTIEELQELDRLKSDFLSNISHELQSPLTPLEGYIELFISGDLGDISLEQKDVLSIMQSCAQRLKNQIANLIFLGSLNLQQSPKEVDEYYFHDSLFNLKRIFSFQLQHNNLDLIFDTDARHSYVNADIQQVSKVLMVILDNAIKFSKENQSVKIKTKNISVQALKSKIEDYKKDKDKLCLSFLPDLLSDSQLYLYIEIEDQGAGIPLEKLTRIFHLFYQADTGSTRKYGGVGVGLNIAQKILEQHQSILCIHSQEDVGTSVSFILPVVSL